MKYLNPNQEEIVLSKPGIMRYYRVPSKNMPIPLQVKLLAYKGINYTYLAVSNLVERPNKLQCDKSVLITTAKSSMIFYRERSRSKNFSEDFIYISIECFKECFLSIMVGFGNAKLTINGKENPKKPRTYLDFKSERKTADYAKEEDYFDKYLPFRRHHKTTSVKLIKIDQISNIKKENKRRKRALIMKAKLDDKEIMRKFILINKIQINKIHDQIIQKKIEKIKKLKCKMTLWINHVKLYKIAQKLYNDAARKKEIKKHQEIQFCSASRIKIEMKIALYNISRIFQIRMKSRALSYFLLFNLVG